jgi:hypothetical protein
VPDIGEEVGKLNEDPVRLIGSLQGMRARLMTAMTGTAPHRYDHPADPDPSPDGCVPVHRGVVQYASASLGPGLRVSGEGSAIAKPYFSLVTIIIERGLVVTVRSSPLNLTHHRKPLEFVQALVLPVVLYLFATGRPVYRLEREDEGLVES